MKETRLITDDESQKRYGEKGLDFLTFPDDLNGQMVKVHYLKSDPVKLDLIFSACLPVDESNEILDPTKPYRDPADYEVNGYKVRRFILTGGYWRGTGELHLTATSPNAALKVYEIKRADGGDMPTDLAKRIWATNGKIEFSITRPSEDKKSTMVYVMATATKKLEDLIIVLEV